MADRLAVDGGTPVRDRLLPYGRQVIDADDEQAVLAALRSDYLTTGPRVEAFEEAFAASVGARHAVAFCNGTAALHGAAHVANFAPGDEGVTTPLTFVATANCVRYVGGTPVLADIRPDTLTIDVAAVAKAVTPRTRAVLPVDYAGAPADLDECLALAQEHGLVVIEDAAHSLGATYRGRAVGTIADLTMFSLHPVKHVTTGEGGMVTTSDDDLAVRLKRFRNHGIDADARTRAARGSWFYDVVETGMNYRLTDVQCALGLSQLKKLPAWLAPTHAVVMSITDRQHDYVLKTADLLKKQGLLVESDLRNEKVGFKIREHTLQRVPYLLVAGDKEVAANLLSVRSRDGKDLGTMSPQTFAERLRRELETHGRDVLEE